MGRRAGGPALPLTMLVSLPTSPANPEPVIASVFPEIDSDTGGGGGLTGTTEPHTTPAA